MVALKPLFYLNLSDLSTYFSTVEFEYNRMRKLIVSYRDRQKLNFSE